MLTVTITQTYLQMLRASLSETTCLRFESRTLNKKLDKRVVAFEKRLIKTRGIIQRIRTI